MFGIPMVIWLNILPERRNLIRYLSNRASIVKSPIIRPVVLWLKTIPMVKIVARKLALVMLPLLDSLAHTRKSKEVNMKASEGCKGLIRKLEK